MLPKIKVRSIRFCRNLFLICPVHRIIFILSPRGGKSHTLLHGASARDGKHGSAAGRMRLAAYRRLGGIEEPGRGGAVDWRRAEVPPLQPLRQRQCSGIVVTLVRLIG